ncbi:MAG: hypothetical protein AB1714_16340 [Acidobacteriota bacterium]
MKTAAFLFALWAVLSIEVGAGESAEEWPRPGWADANGDGINDNFHDATGGGVDDVTGKPYPHTFKFADKNNDRRNDLFIDADGDGVNDLAGTRPGLVLVLDHLRRGINDVTGAKYTQWRVYGDSFGNVKEDTALARSFIDRDMDGVNDIFVDRDGDGICDGRAVPRAGAVPMGMGGAPNDPSCAPKDDGQHR